MELQGLERIRIEDDLRKFRVPYLVDRRQPCEILNLRVVPDCSQMYATLLIEEERARSDSGQDAGWWLVNGLFIAGEDHPITTI